LINLHLKGVWVVATCARVVAFNVGVLGIIGIAIIFITTMSHTTVKGGCCSIVMNIFETEGNILASIVLNRSGYGIGVNIFAEKCNCFINADFGLTSLMAFHTTDIITGLDFYAGGEHHSCFGNGACIVASYALNALRVIGRHCGINFTSFGTIQTKEILITITGMALGTGSGDAVWVLSSIIPMAERFTSHISVTGALPFSQIRGIWHWHNRGFCCCRSGCFGGCCAAASREDCADENQHANQNEHFLEIHCSILLFIKVEKKLNYIRTRNLLFRGFIFVIRAITSEF